MSKKILDEENIRLKVLCKKVRHLFDQVQSTESFEKIKNIKNELIEIEKENNQIEEKYNSEKINTDKNKRKEVLNDMIALTRFEILIFEKDFEKLENIKKELFEIEKEDKKLREKYNLDDIELEKNI